MFRDSRYLLTLLTQCPFVVSTFRDILHVSLVGTGWNLKVIVFVIVPLAYRHVTSSTLYHLMNGVIKVYIPCSNDLLGNSCEIVSDAPYIFSLKGALPHMGFRAEKRNKHVQVLTVCQAPNVKKWRKQEKVKNSFILA